MEPPFCLPASVYVNRLVLDLSGGWQSCDCFSNATWIPEPEIGTGLEVGSGAHQSKGNQKHDGNTSDIERSTLEMKRSLTFCEIRNETAHDISLTATQ